MENSKKKKVLQKVLCVGLSVFMLGAYAGTAIPQYTNTGIVAEAANSEADFYTTENSDGTIAIIGYKGTSSDVVIPSYIYGQKVVQVDALSNSKKDNKDFITSITFPSTVTTIGKFDGYTKIKSIVFPDTITKISVGAFHNCTSLTSVTLPKKMPNLSDGSYYYGYGIFLGCTALKSVTIPSGWTEIPAAMFSDCKNLTTVNIPNTVTKINGAFSGCTSLKSITIPNSVTELGTFGDCTSLTDINIPYGVKCLESLVFQNCTSLKEITIPSSVTEINGEAFSNCTSLKEINIPSSVTTIGHLAFYRCSNLQKIVIPESVTTIDSAAIWACPNLTIYGVKNSYAHKYANNHDIPFKTMEVQPSSVALNKTSMSLGVGETYQLTATVSPSNAGNKTVAWRTSNSKILTVTSNGLVTAKGTGVAWITAKTSNGIEKSCKITVKNPPSKITLTKGILTLGVGESFTIGSNLNDGAAAAKRTYRTSNSSIVKMTRTDWVGEFVAVKPGVAYVTVRTYNGKESTCKVTVKPAPTSVKLNKTNITLKVGQSASVSAIIPDNTGCAKRTFSSSNSSIVKMTKTEWTGNFTAVKPGTAYVTVKTYNGKTATCKVTVTR